MGVTAPSRAAGSNNWMRAAIYLAELQAAQKFFQTNNAGIGGANAAFVRTALRDPGLLTQLAEALDFFTAPAFETDIAQLPVAPGSVQNYFNNQIFGAGYAVNVAAFRARFPIVNTALVTVANNFRNNIQQMCQRVIADRAAIENLLEEEGTILSLTGLTGIRSSGSDFHKGGQQVLILTFSKLLSVGDVPTWGSIKVVYKPSDIEADCLLCGNSEQVNRATPGFMTSSLFEIFNTAVYRYKAANPGSQLRQLPTYGFLPRNYLSTNNPVPVPVPLANSYGYIEYLTYDASFGLNIFNYYPFGSSDFLIFPKQKEAPIIEDFYRQLGELVAIACTFSITDMHLENVRSRKYHPHLIDLELSLTKANANVETTTFFGPAGGINKSRIEGKDYTWIFVEAARPYIDKDYTPTDGQNRLYAQRGTRKLVPVNAFWLLAGLNDGMALLRYAQGTNDFAAWFARLNRVLVRSLPFNTTFFTALRNLIFPDTLRDPVNFGSTLAASIQRNLTGSLDQQGGLYAANPTPQPGFVVLQQPYSGADYQNLDVPSFYHVIGTTGIVDARGVLVPVPNNFNLPNTNVVPIGRTTYFVAPPTANAVYAAQVQTLTGGGFVGRVAALQAEVIAALNTGAAPLNPGVLIP